MRVAAIYDVHGNLPALEAVLREVAEAEVDRVVVGGDVVAGPMPCQTLETLLDLSMPVHFIRGNADREVLAEMTGTGVYSVPEEVKDIVRWVAGQLRFEHQQVLASWPETYSLEIDGLGDVLFCHATPHSDSRIFTRVTPEDHLVPMFADVEASLVVCGHTHMQFDRGIGGLRVVNAGSVGMPYGEPGAFWLLLGPDVELMRAVYNTIEAAERIKGTGYPKAADFAANNVLQTPTEAEALDVFESIGLWGNESA